MARTKIIPSELGTLLLLTLADGTSRYGMRLGDGLAVCTVAPPDTLQVQDGDGVCTWMVAERRLWVLVVEDAQEWVFAWWAPRAGEPEGVTEEGLSGLTGAEGVSAFNVATAAVLAATMLFPAWAGCPAPEGMTLDLRPVWTHPEGRGAEA